MNQIFNFIIILPYIISSFYYFLFRLNVITWSCSRICIQSEEKRLLKIVQNLFYSWLLSLKFQSIKVRIIWLNNFSQHKWSSRDSITCFGSISCWTSIWHCEGNFQYIAYYFMKTHAAWLCVGKYAVSVKKNSSLYCRWRIVKNHGKRFRKESIGCLNVFQFIWDSCENMNPYGTFCTKNIKIVSWSTLSGRKC